ncbi:MAG: hypothetical protein ACK4NF_04370 [Planctomycetota bacterium]
MFNIIGNIVILVLITNFLLANFLLGNNKKAFVHYLFLILILIFLFKKIIKIELYLSEDLRRKSYKSVIKQLINVIIYIGAICGSVLLFYYLKNNYSFILEYLIV